MLTTQHNKVNNKVIQECQLTLRVTFFSILTALRWLGIVYDESCTCLSQLTESGFYSLCPFRGSCATPPGGTGTPWPRSAAGAEMPEWHQSASPPPPNYRHRQEVRRGRDRKDIDNVGFVCLCYLGVTHVVGT